MYGHIIKVHANKHMSIEQDVQQRIFIRIRRFGFKFLNGSQKT